MNVILKGTILSQPCLLEGHLVFFLRCGGQAVTVVRKNREDQLLDALFLCIGQEIVLCACAAEDHVIAEKIRITDYGTRNYVLPSK